MRKLYGLLYCFFALSTALLKAQIVNIPDANFKAALVGNVSINTNLDTEIQTSEAVAFAGTINVNSLGIASLIGIEAFVNIIHFSCTFNSIAGSQDFSANLALQTLDCSFNNTITSLNVTANTALVELTCNQNQLSSLNVSSNTALVQLICDQNQINNLDVSMNTALVTLNCSFNYLTTLNIASNTALVSLNCFNNQISSLDVSSNVALEVLVCGSNPLGSLDVSANTALQTLICSGTQLGSLDLYSNSALLELACSYCSLSSINISANTALLSLECYNNQLSSLDVSGCTALQVLNCSQNYIGNLNVPASTSLIDLDCSVNQLNILDVSSNVSLQELHCEENQLSSLDVSYNTSLEKLQCYDNQLGIINMQNGNNINLISFNAQGNSPLTCVQVDDPAYMNSNWGGAIDPGTSYALSCGPCIVNIPDANFKAALVADLLINTNADSEIQCTEAAVFSGSIFVNSLGITDLTGIEHFTTLTSLSCADNLLTVLDLTANTNLAYLLCGDNDLTQLNVQGLNSLLSISCYSNLLSQLDVSGNPNLQILDCSANQLQQLDVSNNFFLANLTCAVNQISQLNLVAGNALQSIVCNDNLLSQLDVTSNGSVSTLHCYNNLLNNLDLSSISGLTSLLCQNNALINLDLSANSMLEFIRCESNQLSYLNIQNGNNNNLQNFIATNNPLLICVQVDDVAYMNTNWASAIDPFAAYSQLCAIGPIISASGPTTICSGGFVILSSNINSGNVWNTGDTTQSISVSVDGTYFLVDSMGAQLSNQISVIVMPVLTPTIQISVNDDVICSGSSAVFNSTVTNEGTTPSYIWNINGVASGTGSIFNSSSIPNGAIVDCVLHSSELCAIPDSLVSNSITMTVITLPTPTFTLTSNTLTSSPLLAEFTNTTTGAPSNIIYNWSFGDGMIEQNNAGFVNHTYAGNGVYHVGLNIQHPAEGCSKTTYDPSNAAYTITCNAAVSNTCSFLPITNPTGVVNACLGGSVPIQASSFPAGSYLQWNRNGMPMGGQVGPSLMVTQAGFYTLTVISPTDSCSVTTAPVQVLFSQTMPPAPTISATGNNGTCGMVNATLTASGSFSSYLWSNGSTGISINVATAGTYTVTGQGGFGCDAVSLPVMVSSSAVQSPEICMITADTSINKHVLVWEKPAVMNITWFLILKEQVSNSGNYVLIDSVAYSDLSEYTDMSSDAMTGANRYRIAVRDDCGGTSAPSSFSRAMHLQVTPAVGTDRFCSWNAYQGQTQNVSYYRIYTGSDMQNLVLLDSIHAGITWWVDSNPVNGASTVYLIETIMSQSCESTRALRGRSISNGTGNLMVLSSQEKGSTIQANQIKIMSNPTDGRFIMHYSGAYEEQLSWHIQDISGKVITTPRMFSSDRVMIDEELARGTYLLVVTGKTRKDFARFVVIK